MIGRETRTHGSGFAPVGPVGRDVSTDGSGFAPDGAEHEFPGDAKDAGEVVAGVFG